MVFFVCYVNISRVPTRCKYYTELCATNAALALALALLYFYLIGKKVSLAGNRTRAVAVKARNPTTGPQERSIPLHFHTRGTQCFRRILLIYTHGQKLIRHIETTRRIVTTFSWNRYTYMNQQYAHAVRIFNVFGTRLMDDIQQTRSRSRQSHVLWIFAAAPALAKPLHPPPPVF